MTGDDYYFRILKKVCLLNLVKTLFGSEKQAGILESDCTTKEATLIVLVYLKNNWE